MGMYGDRDVTIGGYMGSQMLPYGDIWGQGVTLWGYLGSQGPYGDVWGLGCHHRGIYGVTDVTLWGIYGLTDVTL